MQAERGVRRFRAAGNGKRILVLLALLAAGFAAGRRAVRACLNRLPGGTLFGGDFL